MPHTTPASPNEHRIGWSKLQRSKTRFIQRFFYCLGCWSQTLLLAGFSMLLGCSTWTQPWSLSQKKLANLWHPFSAQREAETFKAKVQKDPFPDASVLNKMSGQLPTGQ